MRSSVVSVCVLALWTLSACAPSAIPPLQANLSLVTHNPNASATATPFQPANATATPIPPTRVPPTETATERPTPIPSPTNVPPTPMPTPATLEPSVASRNSYILYTTLDFAGRSLATDETIRYYNRTGQSLSELVLSVQPNRYLNCFTLISLEQDNQPLDSYTLNGQRMTVSLREPVQPGAATTIAVSYTLALPAKRADGLFGYDFNQANLTDWFPFVVPYSGGWLLHEPMAFGEHLVYDAADIEVNLRAEPGVVIAASAPAEPNGEWTRYRIYGARTFAISASDEFRVSDSAVGPVSIRSYYFDGYQGAGEGILNAAVQSVGLFDAKFAAYPYASLSVVQADINDGQEYDGLVFLSTDFYSQYGGTTRSNLVTIGVHEIAHQWWFGLVGNDQAMEPWLDEALALYSERIFYEFTRGASQLSWWWDFRVDYFGPTGYVDTTIYDGGAFRPYTNAVYLNGAHFMEEFRTRLGDDAFYRFIRDYAAMFARGRATSQGFFALARQYTNRDLTDLIGKYFQGNY